MDLRARPISSLLALLFILSVFPAPGCAPLDMTPDAPDDVTPIEMDPSERTTPAGRLRPMPASCAIELDPAAPAECTIELLNDGETSVEIVAILFGSETPLLSQAAASLAGFEIADEISLPRVIIANETLPIRVRAAAPQPTDLTGSLFVLTNNPNQPEVEIALSASGWALPIAVAETFELAPQNVPQPMAKLGNIVFSGENSQASRAEGEIVAYQWSVLDAPPESSIQLTTPNEVTTQFSYESAAGKTIGVDVIGTYTVRLQVTDDLGLVSTNDADVVVSSISAPPDLSIQLTWDSPAHDFDLYLRRAGADYCSEDSCFFDNCLNAPLDWDASGDISDPDPVLSFDDTWGFGPEFINMTSPLAASYDIAVQVKSAADILEEVRATLRLYVAGSLVWERTSLPLRPGSLWEAAQVLWEFNGAEVFTVDEYLGRWSCDG